MSPDSNKKPSLIRLGFPFDTATWARTKDLLLRRQLLYPTELLPHALKYISFFADLCKGRKKVCRNDVPAARIVKGKTVFRSFGLFSCLFFLYRLGDRFLCRFLGLFGFCCRCFDLAAAGLVLCFLRYFFRLVTMTLASAGTGEG